jgi:hypothetical protein
VQTVAVIGYAAAGLAGVILASVVAVSIAACSAAADHLPGKVHQSGAAVAGADARSPAQCWRPGPARARDVRPVPRRAACYRLAGASVKWRVRKAAMRRCASAADGWW